MSFLDELRARRKKLADVLADEEYLGIRQIVEDLYPDRAHFIYELLQNAEDTGATEVSFVLKEDALTFEHNGRPFNEKDVERITNIGERTEQEDKIGRFGIGFKAVFAYSETPHIWSTTYSFKITELVLPSEILSNPNLGQRTRFKFPFNNPKKSREDAYAEIASGLDELAETTLLFLRNIETIEWKIGDSISGEVLRISHSEYHIEVLKQIGNYKTFSSHFLRLSTPIENDGRPTQSVSVAYGLEFLPNVSEFVSRKALSKQLRITPANPGLVAVFFPAEKETSGLRFHLHAPFVPELSRASIKETPANEPLFDKLAKLTATSLREIRDLGLLTGEFLAVLPNPQDALPRRYAPIRQAVIEAMNNEPLTPTQSKFHAPARNLLQAKASLKELLSEEDLKFLIEHEDDPPKWAIGVSQRNSNQDRFLSGLEIETWDIEQFVQLLIKKTSKKMYSLEDEPDAEFMIWLSAKPVEWHQQMYAVLYRELSANKNFNQLRSAQIVRLSTGTYSSGGKCYFASNEVEHDEILPRVDSRVYLSGKKKSQQEDARQFLEEIGVSEVGEAEEVEGILKARYTYEAEVPSKKTYLKHLRHFIQLVEKEPSNAKIFSEYFILERADNKWAKPAQVFIDSPFVETGLSAYYDVLEDESAPKALSKEYRFCGVNLTKFVEFVKNVGVIDKLPISETPCYKNPRWDYLCRVPGERYTSPINRDYVVLGLDGILKTPTLELSRLVWRTMNALDGEYLKATYQKNWSGGYRSDDSQLVHLLKSAAWVPQKDAGFVRPCDALRSQLPKGFPFDEGQEWLSKVDFGGNARKRSEEYRGRDQAAKTMGFASAEQAEELAKLVKETGLTTEEIRSRVLPASNKEKPAFPTKTLSNPERRQARLAEQLNNTPKKEYEQRDRSVRTTRGTVDPVMWLRNLYTNEVDQMICQICKEEMPFRKRDGEYYFETVEALSGDHLAKEHEAQFIALCPLCAAMYNEFIKHDESAMAVLKRALMTSDEPEIPLSLGELDTSVRFVESHFNDVKTILREVDGNSNTK